MENPEKLEIIALPQDTAKAVGSGHETQAVDPYFYTRGKDFTSEIFKIELLNVPNHVGYTQLKKLLGRKLDLKPHKIKLISHTSPPTVFVTFRCEVDRQAALNALASYHWKGKMLNAKQKASPSADPLVKKRKEAAADLDADESIERDKKVHKTEDIQIRLKNAVTPLWNVPYSEQLEQKQQSMREVLFKYGRELQKTNSQIASWLKKQREENEGVCCRFLPICPSPVENEYRNKCEFNVGHHPETGQKTVGFRISSYKAGSKCVVSPYDLPNLSPSMLLAAECFEAFVRESQRDVFNPETNGGHWRQLTVRIGQSQLMLIVGFHPQDLTQEELAKEKADLLGHFVGGPGARCNPTSIYWQLMRRKGIENEAPPPDHLWGEERIEESLVGLRLLISPKSFFQINTPAAEVLYRAIGELAEVDTNTTVVDLCCGTGAIGLSLANNSQKVIGIELCQEAVVDARRNAERNGVKNAEFICGKAEDVLYDVMRRLAGTDSPVVAIVDPPRAGLHNKVIKCIRGVESLRRLVYVSCSPLSALANFVDLSRPASNNFRGNPFLPVCALPVDLFPHTPHCEIVILFRR